MIAVNDSIKDLFKHDFLPYRVKPVSKELTMTFSNPPLTIGNTKRKSDTFSLDECLCDGDDLVFGDCQAAIMKFTCADVTADIVGKEFTCTETVDGVSIPFGVYKVWGAEKTNDLRYKAITAYDRMKNFDVNIISWYEGLTFPLSVKQMRDSLCAYVGITQESVTLVNDAMTIEKTIEAESLNGLTVLKAICEINGCFGHMSRTGILQYKVLSKTEVNDIIPKVTSKTLEHEEYTTKAIDKLQICQEDGDIGAIVGTGTNCYTIKGNFLVYGKTASELATIAQNVSANILGISYKPFTDDLYGLPYIEVGDRVTFEGQFTSYVLRRTLTGVQALRDSFDTKGNETISENTSVNEEIKQLQNKSAIMKRTVEEMTNTITNLETNVNDAVTTVSEMENTVQQTSSSLSAEITARKESITSIIGNNYCDEIPIDDDDVCDDDEDTVVSNLLIDTSAKLELLSDRFGVALQDNVNQLNASLTLTTTQFSTQISDLQNNTSTQIQQLSNSIALKVDVGGVSNQLSIETGGINISGNRFTWNATNSSMSADGTLTCNNANLTGKFTNTGSLGTVSITTGYISVTAGSGSNITEVSSGGLRVSNGTNEIVLTPTNIGGNVLINGYTPITSDNIAQQNVSKANYADSAGNALLANNATNASYASSAGSTSSCSTGYLTLSGGTLTAPAGSLYIGQNTVKANTITQLSKRDYKKEIEDFHGNALDIICDSRIRAYRYKTELDQEEIDKYKKVYPTYDYKKHIGLLVDESNPCFTTQCEDGLDLGAMVALSWKAIQEMSKRLNILEERICQA